MKMAKKRGRRENFKQQKRKDVLLSMERNLRLELPSQ